MFKLERILLAWFVSKPWLMVAAVPGGGAALARSSRQVGQRETSMRCFLIGIAGFLVAALLAAIVIPQYADFRSRETLSEAMTAIAPLRMKIAEYLAKGPQKPTEAGNAALTPREPIPGVNYLKVMSDGTIVFRSARHGQLIVLEPEVRGSSVEWKCVGAPAREVPRHCR
jgi:Tfp pilus assembly major pilin PilA